MHLDLPHMIYAGGPLDDPAMLARLPEELAEALKARNGCIGWLGALHVRGACLRPLWHSLRHAWEGPDSLHRLYEEVRPSDVPFAEDAFGDQFLLREGKVLRLNGELGEASEVADSLDAFFARLWEDAEAVLDYQPLLAFRGRGQELEPGQLLAAFPPFVLAGEHAEREIRPVDALERRRALSELARQLHGLPEGAEVRLTVGRAEP